MAKSDDNLASDGRFELTVATAIAGLALVTFVLLWFVGLQGRSTEAPAPRVFLLRSETQALSVWRRHGVRGRALIHFGAHMPIKFINTVALRSILKAKPAVTAENGGLPKGLTDNNYLYAASRANIARKIYGVVPNDIWAGVKERLAGNDKFLIERDYAYAWMDGLQLRPGSLAGLPHIGEPAVLNFSADYFVASGTSPEVAMAKVRLVGARPDIVTIALPSKKDRAYERARRSIDELVTLLKAGRDSK